MKTAVLVSGGVDSSVAVRLLLKAGRDVHVFYLKIWLENEMSFLGKCPWDDDLVYVRSLCEQANVPLHIISLQKEYHDRVLTEALEEIRRGRTPNPDILCNQHIKFGAFYDSIDESYDCVATGHYARSIKKDGLTWLQMSPDPIKDQTYFLSMLNQAQLSRAMFPIGGYTKKQIRELAKDFDVPSKNRPESQGLCFLGEIQYDEFVRFHFGQSEGDIVEKETGLILGKHKGYWFYTIGQRKGLDLSGGPWYVVGKDIEKNVVYLAHRLSMHRNERDSFEIDRLRWLSQRPEKTPLLVKLRHGPRLYDCELYQQEDAKAHVKLIGAKDRGIAPGQYAVFYDGEYCLGGGMVCQ